MSAQTSANRSGKLKAYFKGVKSEMKKVTWPGRKALINHTVIVILISVIIALIVFGPKKLPEIGKAAGQTLREFKKSTKELTSDVVEDFDEIKEEVKALKK